MFGFGGEPKLSLDNERTQRALRVGEITEAERQIGAKLTPEVFAAINVMRGGRRDLTHDDNMRVDKLAEENGLDADQIRSYIAAPASEESD